MGFASGVEHNRLVEWSQLLQFYDKVVTYSSDVLNIMVSIVIGTEFPAGKKGRLVNTAD